MTAGIGASNYVYDELNRLTSVTSPGPKDATNPNGTIASSTGFHADDANAIERPSFARPTDDDHAHLDEDVRMTIRKPATTVEGSVLGLGIDKDRSPGGLR